MILFLVAAVSAFLVSRAVPTYLDRIKAREAYRRYVERGRAPGGDLDDWRAAEDAVNRWLQRCQVAAGIAAALFAVLLAALLTTSTGPVLTVSRWLTEDPVVRLCMGLIFGALLHNWWPSQWRPNFNHTAGFYVGVAVLIALPAFVVISPYFDKLFTSITRLRAGNVEAEFVVTRAENRPAFEADRHMLTAGVERLRIGSVLDGDIKLYGLLSTHVLQVKSNASASIEYARLRAKLSDAEDAKAFFVGLVEPLINCVDEAQTELRHERDAQEALRSIATPLLQLTTGKNSDPEALLNSIYRAWYAMRELVDDKTKCANPPPSRWPESLKEIPELAKAPYIHMLIANLLWYTGNVAAARTVLENSLTRFEENASLHYLYATSLFASEEPFRNIRKHLDTARDLVKAHLYDVELAAKRGNSWEAVESLRRRYRAAESLFKNDFAYWAAHSGVSELTALEYAAENYKRREEWGADSVEGCTVIDTYGYVKMVFGERRSGSSARDDLQEAQRYFKEAVTCNDSRKGPQKRELQRIIEAHLRRATDLVSR